MKKALFILVIIAFASSASVSQAGFSLDKIKNPLDGSSDCKKGDDKCKNREKVKTAGKVIAVSVAAGLIKEMIVSFKSKRITNEEEVANNYKKEHKTLPKQPLVFKYLCNAHPGKVVKPGSKVAIRSDIIVVPGSDEKTAFIEEKLTIYDNENNKEELTSLKKAVNKKTKRGGRYQNEFSFTLPQGLPQGIYPASTNLILNGKDVKAKRNDLQLVLHIDINGDIKIVALADQRR